jgi:hypothetical protein
VRPQLPRSVLRVQRGAALGAPLNLRERPQRRPYASIIGA